MGDHSNIKSLRDKRNDLNSKISIYTHQLKTAQEEIKKLSKEMSSIDTKIRNLEQPPKKQKISITDHALLRYLERIHGFNIKNLRETLLTEKVVSYINNYKSGKITENGITYVFKNRVVVTIMIEEKKV
jgi:septal ring factor EnvC (AmiA/AmiB activator)